MKLKEGINGADEFERSFEIHAAEVIPGRERGTPIAAAYDYWRARCGSRVMPESEEFNDGELGGFGWRLRKFDVRKGFPGNFSLVRIDGEDSFAVMGFRTLNDFERDCLTLDILECMYHRAPLHLIAQHFEGEFFCHCRTVVLPTVDRGDAISWIYSVTVHDDEMAATPSVVALAR